MDSPFKFLDAYDKEDYDRFFGRQKETAQLYNSIFASNLTLLYGGSGTGKTSLVNCGLANKFYDSDWLPLFIRREENINQSIGRALRKAYSEIDKETLAAFDQNPIKNKLNKLYLKHFKPLYLIFDQFEELFILGDQKEQNKFYLTIKEILQANLHAKVLIIVREEWIAYLNDFEKVVPTLFDNRLRIEKMNEKTLKRVIAGNIQHARGVKIQVEEPLTVIEKILINIRDQRLGIDLANVQVYLDRLYRRDLQRQDNPNAQEVIFDPKLVDLVGPMENVLSIFLDEQMAELEDNLKEKDVPEPKGLPLEILFSLTTTDGTKQALSLDQIIHSLPPTHKVSKDLLVFCIDELKKIRILKEIG